MLEGLGVAVIVAVAFSYAAWALMPAGVRTRIARASGAWARRPGRPRWLARGASAIERAAQARLGGCADCSASHAARPAPPGKESSTD